MNETPREEYLTLFPEYGAFAWIADKPGMLGDCCAVKMCEEYDGVFNDVRDFQVSFGLSDALTRDLVEWSDAFNYTVSPEDAVNPDKAETLHPLYKMLDYRAETLARRLKAEVGEKCHVQYCTRAKDGAGFVEV